MTEIERKLTVAEEWARRDVMEPVTNEQRLADFEAKKALFHCAQVVVINRALPCVTKASQDDRVIRRLHFRPAPGNGGGLRFG